MNTQHTPELRERFENKFPVPYGVVFNGRSYVAEEPYTWGSDWKASKLNERWVGWQAVCAQLEQQLAELQAKYDELLAAAKNHVRVYNHKGATLQEVIDADEMLDAAITAAQEGGE